MQSILDDLFYQHYRIQEKDPAALQRIATETGMLKKDFNNWQKTRLRRLIDDKDLLAYEQANNSFASGVRYGVRFMLEVFSANDATIAD